MKVLPVIRHAKIVGNYFRDDDAKAKFRTLVEGDLLTFETEPGNAHDKYAVKVIAGGVWIGYVPKEISASVYTMLEFCTMADLIGIAHKGGGFSLGVKR